MGQTMFARTTVVLLALFGGAVTAVPQEMRPGVWAAPRMESLPLPKMGYQVYMVGEMHGLEENADFQLRYLTEVHSASGLRDVALEEKSVYEEAAQAFVDGKSDALPQALCLRAGVLDGIRRLNAAPGHARFRVHLTDIDSPAGAIREHLTVIRKRIPSSAGVSIPVATEIEERGLETVKQFQRFRMDARTRSELRTVEHSIRAYRDGLEVGTGTPKGSPYLEDREQAVASNIEDLIRIEKIRSLLVLYGCDHVSRTMRRDGGPNRDQPLAPVALRLERAGIKTVSVVTFPLAGRSFWRGRESELPWTAGDGHLESGETLDKVLSAAPEASFLYIDTKRQHALLPSEDISHYAVDGFLLFRSAAPMTNRCATH
jgi:hypothetical protein